MARLTCCRCYATYPNVNIVRCHNIVFADICLCRTCHKRFHPTCKRYESAVRPEDKLCDTCMTRVATLVCPQCTGKHVEVQLCNECSQLAHTDMKQMHLDHVRPVPA